MNHELWTKRERNLFRSFIKKRQSITMHSYHFYVSNIGLDCSLHPTQRVKDIPFRKINPHLSTIYPKNTFHDFFWIRRQQTPNTDLTEYKIAFKYPYLETMNNCLKISWKHWQSNRKHRSEAKIFPYVLIFGVWDSIPLVIEYLPCLDPLPKWHFKKIRSPHYLSFCNFLPSVF